MWTGIWSLLERIAHFLESSHTLGRHCIDFRFFNEEFGTVETNQVCKFFNGIKELIQIDRSCKFNVSKMTWTELVGLFAGGTDFTVLNDTETSIKDAIGNWLIALIGFISGHLYNRSFTNIVWVGNPKLNTDDCITHYLLSNSVFIFIHFLLLREFQRCRPQFIVV